LVEKPKEERNKMSSLRYNVIMVTRDSIDDLNETKGYQLGNKQIIRDAEPSELKDLERLIN
jgi:hypothetical protein